MICILKFKNEHNFLTTVRGDMVLVFCPLSCNASYHSVEKFVKVSRGFRVTDLNRG